MVVSELLFWGVMGMITELCFTAIKGLVVDKQVNLVGHTSLWMFPIYAFGLTYGFDFIERLIPKDTIRWLSYPLWIWLTELAVALPASRLGVKLWDYSYLPEKLHWRGIISFVHYPLWMAFGILAEMIK